MGVLTPTDLMDSDNTMESRAPWFKVPDLLGIICFHIPLFDQEVLALTCKWLWKRLSGGFRNLPIWKMLTTLDRVYLIGADFFIAQKVLPLRKGVPPPLTPYDIMVTGIHASGLNLEVSYGENKRLCVDLILKRDEQNNVLMDKFIDCLFLLANTFNLSLDPSWVQIYDVLAERYDNSLRQEDNEEEWDDDNNDDYCHSRPNNDAWWS